MTRDIYLAIGDSITAGYDASHPAFSFVGHVARFTQQKQLTQRTVIIAKNGWTTKDIAHAVANTVSARLWERVNVLTLLTGGNDLRNLIRDDFLFGIPLSRERIQHTLVQFRNDFARLCETISHYCIPSVIVSTLYNPVPNFALADEAINGLNLSIRETAEPYHFDVVDVYKSFKNYERDYIHGYRSGTVHDLAKIFSRPIHPNDRGHQEIANLVIGHLTGRVTPRVSGTLYAPSMKRCARKRVRSRAQ